MRDITLTNTVTPRPPFKRGYIYRVNLMNETYPNGIDGFIFTVKASNTELRYEDVIYDSTGEARGAMDRKIRELEG